MEGVILYLSLKYFFLAYLLRSYQKKLARTAAVEGNECIEELTGPGRDIHTNHLANILIQDPRATNDVVGQCANRSSQENSTIALAGSALPREKESAATNAKDETVLTGETSSDEKSLDDDVQIVIPLVNVIPDDPIEDNSIPSNAKGLMTDIENLGDPVISIQPLNAVNSSLVVQDDIDVKREDLAETKKLPFTEEEDKFLQTGVKIYGKRWTDMLKDTALIFHPSRNKDTLRGRWNTLSGSRKRSRRAVKKNI